MQLDKVEKFNRDVKSWGANTKQKFLMSMAGLQLHHRVELRKKSAKNIRNNGLKGPDAKKALVKAAGEETLYESLKVKYKSGSGVIYFVSFPFARHGIFLVKGVSRGHKMNNPREKKDWITPVLQVQMDVLASIIADNYSDAVAGEAIKVIAGREVIKL